MTYQTKLQRAKQQYAGNPLWICAEMVLTEMLGLRVRDADLAILRFQFDDYEWECDGGATWTDETGIAFLVNGLTIPESKKSAFLDALYSLD